MPIVLTKGVPVSLQKEDGSTVSLKKVHVGAGWDVARGKKSSIDLDVIVLMLESSKKKNVITQANGQEGVVYFGAKSSACGGIVLDKDNRTGEGDGYDENVNFNLEQVTSAARCFPICINIFSGAESFGEIENAFIEVNVEGLDTIHIDLTEDHAADNIVHVADIYATDDGVWRVKKIDLGLTTGLKGLMDEYGVPTV